MKFLESTCCIIKIIIRRSSRLSSPSLCDSPPSSRSQAARRKHKHKHTPPHPRTMNSSEILAAVIAAGPKAVADQPLLRALANQLRAMVPDMSPALLRAATAKAGAMHDEWFGPYRPREEAAGRDPLAPRIRKAPNGTMVDINKPSSELDPAWLETNISAIMFALAGFRFFAESISDLDLLIQILAAAVHENWLINNPQPDDSPLRVVYADLPEVEKQKDIDVVLHAQAAMKTL